MAKIIPIDVIKGISGKYGNKSSDYFATNRSSNQIHLAKIVNPYQGPPTEKQKAQQENAIKNGYRQDCPKKAISAGQNRSLFVFAANLRFLGLPEN